MKKDLIKLILIFFISIFVIGMIPIVQFIWAFMPTKLVTKEEKQHIEYVVNTAFEDNLGLKVKKIEIPTLVSRVTYQYDVKVQVAEDAEKILTDELEDGTYSYYANNDDEPSSLLTDLTFSSVLDTNSHPMLNALYFDKESVLKPVKFKKLSTDLDYDVTDAKKEFYRDLVQIKKKLKYNPKTEKYEVSAEEIKNLRKDMIRLSEKYGAQLNLYLNLEGRIPDGATLTDYVDFTSLPKNVYVVVWGENGKLDRNGFQAE
ncbi:hypothetical protein I6L85_05620 [Streptococcus gordonii]|uniref:hypothetical protein n=1 Tax=Streptococcus gordonii TaxID=1302 RepID=UPI000DA36AE1|nr:hypothetical protein [Streptococcus gordonii]QXA17961.1 hypothetical protein I6L85_05620 [Streptococcus gordonii]SQG04048.1 Uncharacterised protein [Streptococcus gordonii]